MLKQLYEQAQRVDAAWVDRHTDDLLKAIRAGLRDDDQRVMAVDLLLHIFPHLMWRDDLKAWEPIINEAVERVGQPRDVEGKQAEYVITESFIIQRLDHSSKVKQSRKRKRRRLNPRKLYEDYMILLMTLCCTRQIDAPAYRATELLRFARTVNHQAIYHRTYTAMACIYNTKGDHAKALDLAQMAYDYWRGQKRSELDVAMSAHEMARACTGLGESDAAAMWLQIAQDTLNGSDYVELTTHVTQQAKKIVSNSA